MGIEASAGQKFKGMPLAIRADLKKSLPFGRDVLPSRHVVALIMTYYGDSDNVHMLMQLGNNKTRAYFVNENGLKGFIVRGVIGLLKDLEMTPEWKEVTQYQHVDMQTLCVELGSKKDAKEKIDFLGEQ